MSDIEDETERDSTSLYKPSFVLIAVDTHPSMFVKREKESGEKSTPFKDCVNASYQIANSLIFTKSKRSWSPFGIVLAAEDTSASFLDFNTNVLDGIKFLKKQNDLPDEELINCYQRKGSFNLSAFFLFCKKKFKEISSVFYKRTIILITNDDNPVQNDKAQRFAALNEAKNFEANDIEFQLVTMNADFDYSLFYNELFSVIKAPPIENIVEDEDGLVTKLSSAILKRYSQRKIPFFPFNGDKSRFIKMIQKNFVHEETLYNNAFVSTEGKALKKIVKEESDKPKTFELPLKSSTAIEFDLIENHELKSNNLPIGYTLMYVSSPITETGLCAGKPQLLEVDYKEDLQFFNSFWQYCADKNKVLVCVRKLRVQDRIRFVELIPKYANNTRLFLVKGIPFVNELHYPSSNLEIKDEVDESNLDAKINVTNDLIDSLTFDYDPKMFPNPALSKKKAFIRSKLLDEPQETVEDVTLDDEGIDSRIGEIAEKFNSLFNLGQETGTKRKATATRGRAKKAK